MVRHEFSYIYRDTNIPYVIYSNTDEPTIETILFLGTVQVGKLPKWVAELCPTRTAVVQGAPHWNAKADGSDIPAFVRGFTKSAFANVFRAFSVSSPIVIADSQAAPAVVSLFASSRYDWSKLVLLQPLGLTVKAYGNSSKERATTLKRRVVSNARYQLLPLLYDKRLRYNHKLLNKTVNMRDTKATAQYTAGLKYDIVPELAKLYNVNQNIVVICGEYDKLFPASEIRKSLRKSNVSLKITTVKKVPHSPLASRQGGKLLNEAFRG